MTPPNPRTTSAPLKKRRKSRPSYVVQIMQSEGHAVVMQSGDPDTMAVSAPLLRAPLLNPPKIVASTSAVDLYCGLRSNLPTELFQEPSRGDAGELASASGAEAADIDVGTKASLLGLGADSLAANKLLIHYISSDVLPDTPVADLYCIGRLSQ